MDGHTRRSRQRTPGQNPAYRPTHPLHAPISSHSKIVRVNASRGICLKELRATSSARQLDIPRSREHPSRCASGGHSAVTSSDRKIGGRLGTSEISQTGFNSPPQRMFRATGCGAGWKRASFGTRRSLVQIQSARPSTLSQVITCIRMGSRHLVSCGTPGAYFRHYKNGEKPCEACRQAQNESVRIRRGRIKNGSYVPLPLKPCGTYAAYQRHRRANEDPCEACDSSAREYWRSIPRSLITTPVDVSRCGTLAGYTQHRRRGHAPCDLCREAKRAYDNARNRDAGISARHEAVCGTSGGYSKHRRLGEEPCESCLVASREGMRRRRGSVPFKAAECGTPSGYFRHWRLGEPACEPCLQARRDSAKTRRYWKVLWEEQDGICALCDQPMPFVSASVHVDHIIPRSRNGSDERYNLQATHPRCNIVKCNRSNEDARRILLSGAA